MQFWVDPKHEFVLRQVRDSQDAVGAFIAEITKVEFNKPIQASVFTLDAPQGARRTPQSMVFKQPFLSPTYIPELPTLGAGISGGGGPINSGQQIEERSLMLQDGKLAIRQETSPQGPLPDGERIDVAGVLGVVTKAGSENAITWDILNLRIKVSGPLSLEELMKIAVSMQ